MIAIDFVGTNLNSGTKTYNINFCNELNSQNIENETIVFICKNYVDQIDLNFKKNDKIRYIIKPNFLSITFLRLLWMQLVLPFELKFLGVKTLYSPMNFSPLLLKIFKIKSVLALHSILPWFYFDLMPGNFFRNFLTKKFMEFSIKLSEILIVPSNFAKNEIAKILNINENKILVVYLGVDKRLLISGSKDFIKEFDYDKSYILSVLSCVKYHNIINLLKAFKTLKDEINFDLKFVLVLNILDKIYYYEVNKFIKENFNNNEIKIFTNLESKYLINLYKKSLLYLFTSYCEVFGLTTLEAMAQKTPVIVSNKSALPEINSNAAEYFDPDNIVEIKEKIKSIINNENNKKKLLNNANDHYRKYTWENNFSQTLSAIVKINND